MLFVVYFGYVDLVEFVVYVVEFLVEVCYCLVEVFCGFC